MKFLLPNNLDHIHFFTASSSICQCHFVSLKLKILINYRGAHFECTQCHFVDVNWQFKFFISSCKIFVTPSFSVNFEKVKPKIVQKILQTIIYTHIEKTFLNIKSSTRKKIRK